MANTDILIFNGVDGATGAYLTPPLTPDEIAAVAQARPLDAPGAPAQLPSADPSELSHRQELKWRHQQATEAFFAPVEGGDPKYLDQASSGVDFAHDADHAVREALGDLLAHRQAQAAGQQERRYREPRLVETGVPSGPSRQGSLSWPPVAADSTPPPPSATWRRWYRSTGPAGRSGPRRRGSPGP